MLKKGQVQMNMGLLISAAIAIIVGAILMVSVAGYVGTTSNIVSSSNESYTAPADGVTIDLEGQELIGTPVVTNGTDAGWIIDAANYTIDEGISETTSMKTIRYTAVGSEFDGLIVNITYDRGDDGYIEDGGARSMASLILIFMGLMIALVALYAVMKNKFWT